MEFIWKELKKISLFGRNLQFEKDYNDKYTSLSSFFLTLLLIISTVIASFIFGKEIYERKTPKFTSSRIPININNTVFNLEEFPILLNFRYENGMPINDENLFKLFKINVMIVNIVNGSVNRKFENISKCKYEDFKNEVYKEHLKFQLTQSKMDYYCISSKNFVFNKFGGIDSNSIVVQVFKCNTDCHNKMDSLIDGTFTTVSFLNGYLMPSDYNNPIKPYFEKYPIKINNNVLRDVTMSFNKNTLTTNRGWIFTDKITESYISLNSAVRDISFSNSTLANIVIESENQVLNSSREYIKIQEILANIGGFFNAVFILFSIIFNNYIKFEYYVYIYNKCREFENEKKIESSILANLTNKNVNILKNNFVAKKQETSNLQNISKMGILEKDDKEENNSFPKLKKFGVQKKLSYNSQYEIDKSIQSIDSIEADENANKSKNNSSCKIENQYENKFHTFQNLNEKRINKDNHQSENLDENKEVLDKIDENNDFKVNLNLIEKYRIIDKYNINNNIKANTLDLLSKDINIEEPGFTLYFEYIYLDIICCRNVFTNMMEISQNRLSFDNFLKNAHKLLDSE